MEFSVHNSLLLQSVCNIIQLFTIVNQLLIVDEPATWKPKGIVEKSLKEKSFGHLCEFYDYPKEHHGFVCRGNTKITKTKDAINDCMLKIIEFINKLIK